MRYRIKQGIFFLGIMTYNVLMGISIVYNFRIAQVTKQSIVESSPLKTNRIVALLFDQYQKKYQGGVTQNFAGAFASWIYNLEPYYLRIDGAFSDILQKTNHVTTFSGAETDDLLFTMGRNFKSFERNRTTISALFGVPTHEIFTLQHVSFGYSQVGMGLQLDGAYELAHQSDVLYGARLIYFVPRTARVICPDQEYLFSIGKIADILLAFKHNQGHHGFECGYTQRWDFGSHVSPVLDDTAAKIDYVRSNFYAIYKYNFLVNDLENRLLFNISYGFDQKPIRYGNKSIITVWASWNLSF